MNDITRNESRQQPRYVVTELEGWERADAARGAHRVPGLSVQVLDRLYCYRVVRSWRSEDYGGPGKRKREYIRHAAATYCAQLNGGEPPAPLARSYRFRPTCPNCGKRAAVWTLDGARCECGANFYRREAGFHIDRAQRAARHE